MEFLTLSFYLRDFSRILEITPSVFIKKLSRVLSGNGPFFIQNKIYSIVLTSIKNSFVLCNIFR